jgi:hypothetical protein
MHYLDQQLRRDVRIFRQLVEVVEGTLEHRGAKRSRVGQVRDIVIGRDDQGRTWSRIAQLPTGVLLS